MLSQVTGAATATVVVLGYVLLVQAMTAAIVLLCEFILLRVRELRRLLATAEGAPEPEPRSQVEQPTYRLGGDLRW